MRDGSSSNNLNRPRFIIDTFSFAEHSERLNILNLVQHMVFNRAFAPRLRSLRPVIYTIHIYYLFDTHSTTKQKVKLICLRSISKQYFIFFQNSFFGDLCKTANLLIFPALKHFKIAFQNQLSVIPNLIEFHTQDLFIMGIW